MNFKKIYLVLILASLFFAVSSSNLYANDGTNFAYIGRGFFRILTAVFELPKHVIEKTLTEPLIVGTVDGAVSGTVYAVSAVAKGTLDIARGVAPYAKYMVFFI